MRFGSGTAVRALRAVVTAALGIFVAGIAPVWAGSSTPCEVPDNGGGTVNLPPEGCGYVSPQDLHIMIEGLPAGTTIEVAAEHNKFFNISRVPGGPLGGEQETFDSILFLDMQGTGDLAAFNRFITLQVACVVSTGPRNPADNPQVFPNEMVQLEGELFGDPDFDYLRVTAGSAFGLPSPGQTTLTDLGDGTFNVDSFFDITYQIEFQGAPGSVLAEMGGTTNASVDMGAGVTVAPPCTVADDGTGTVRLPPDGCGYVSPQDLHVMIDGLPPGTTIEIDPMHDRFFNVQTFPGGTLGGDVETFDSFLTLQMQGTGDLSGYNRVLQLPINCEAHTGPRTPGAAHQSFPNEMVALQGEIFGDPDFDFLRVTGGSAFGLPSPGHTTLTRLGPPGSDFNVDSFFDITYQIEFQGTPGGPLDRLGGLTEGTVTMGAGQPAPPTNPCEVVDNGTGTVDLPPIGCEYLSPNEVHMIIDGLPPGTEINIGLSHRNFFQVQTQPGGIFGVGGEIEHFQSFGLLSMVGTGELQGFNRQIQLPLQCEVHTGPRQPGDPVQSFPNEMVFLGGQITGDQDFESLTVVAGREFGLPSPGHTTLTRQSPPTGRGGGGGTFTVDSFFDIAYTIRFQGAPESILEGLGGDTQGTVRMSTGDRATAVEPQTQPNVTRLLAPRPNPFNPTTRIPFVLEAAGHVELVVFDVTGRVVRTLVSNRMEIGRHDITWNGRDQDDRLLGTGTYFYELRVDGVVVDTRKATMVK